ncbi:MAG: hypothetical protein IT522_13780 [Burkholderiales bacterium]|nr:hypothetical protein [Burkholderiales bacterium]
MSSGRDAQIDRGAIEQAERRVYAEAIRNPEAANGCTDKWLVVVASKSGNFNALMNAETEKWTTMMRDAEIEVE